jgi:hypothetical protein
MNRHFARSGHAMVSVYGHRQDCKGLVQVVTYERGTSALNFIIAHLLKATSQGNVTDMIIIPQPNLTHIWFLAHPQATAISIHALTNTRDHGWQLASGQSH